MGLRRENDEDKLQSEDKRPALREEKGLQSAKDKNRVLQRLQGATDDKVVISPLSNQNQL